MVIFKNNYLNRIINKFLDSKKIFLFQVYFIYFFPLFIIITNYHLKLYLSINNSYDFYSINLLILFLFKYLKNQFIFLSINDLIFYLY